MKRKVILASGSPRRKELLESLNIDFEVKVSHVEEVVDYSLSVEDIVKSFALQKAQAVYNDNQDCLVIGSDTIVVVNNQILGKPKDSNKAKEMMEMLKNNHHKVLTAVAFISKEETKVICDEAIVYFNDISEKEIDEYLLTNEPYDKAGAYAIQGWAGKYIRKIEGNFYTIMGLPLDIVYDYLKDR